MRYRGSTFAPCRELWAQARDMVHPSWGGGTPGACEAVARLQLNRLQVPVSDLT